MAPVGLYPLRHDVITTTSTTTTLSTLEIIILGITVPAILMAVGVATYLYLRYVRRKRLLQHGNRNMAEEIRGISAKANLDSWMRQVGSEAVAVYSEGKDKKEEEGMENENDKEWEIIEKET